MQNDQVSVEGQPTAHLLPCSTTKISAADLNPSHPSDKIAAAGFNTKRAQLLPTRPRGLRINPGLAESANPYPERLSNELEENKQRR